ncbi:phosphoadenosine phosphosulfate reductase [Gemmobacter sp.]|uniref:phosphoadenosine phosphosulfate reductase n=1 Tax=Gemmobacter sp. TaxID=1898957 RepID=UPI002AFF9CCF|nr:phosphoadenosine phosphosulfate reductase [Gemmobacter sp.]
MSEQTTLTTSAPPGGREAWLRRLDLLSEDSGYFEPLGLRHWAYFADEGPTLLVTFQTIQTLEVRPAGDMPAAQRVAEGLGWSQLCLLSDGETWFRDRRVWGYFDRLIDEGFFEDFDRVLFHGAGMGGYAACAFSVAAPGASVLAIRPVATLSPRVAGWDRRHLRARRLDFSSRFGFAPDMVEGAGPVVLIHDPAVPEDAMHSALFRRRHVVPLACRHLGAEPEVSLAEMDLMDPLLTAAAEARLTPDLWARLWRARRDHLPWMRNIGARLAAGPARGRELAFLRLAAARFPEAPRFRKRLEALTAGDPPR